MIRNEINYRKMAGLLVHLRRHRPVFVGCVAILFQQLMSVFNIFILEGISPDMAKPASSGVTVA
jgi:hypothetical protein